MLICLRLLCLNDDNISTIKINKGKKKKTNSKFNFNENIIQETSPTKLGACKTSCIHWSKKRRAYHYSWSRKPSSSIPNNNNNIEKCCCTCVMNALCSHHIMNKLACEDKWEALNMTSKKFSTKWQEWVTMHLIDHWVLKKKQHCIFLVTLVARCHDYFFG